SGPIAMRAEASLANLPPLSSSSETTPPLPKPRSKSAGAATAGPASRPMSRQAASSVSVARPIDLAAPAAAVIGALNTAAGGSCEMMEGLPGGLGDAARIEQPGVLAEDAVGVRERHVSPGVPVDPGDVPAPARSKQQAIRPAQERGLTLQAPVEA